jgi:hypothetical protein
MLTKEVQPFFSGRARGHEAELDFVDVTARNGEVEFVTTGVSVSASAEVKSAGCARLPYPVFEALFRRPERLGQGSLTIHIEDGKVEAGRLALNNPGITIWHTEGRCADLPIDAPLWQVLALSFEVEPDKLVDSGLWARVRAAQREAAKLIDRAAEILEPLAVDAAMLEDFARNQIKGRKLSGT